MSALLWSAELFHHDANVPTCPGQSRGKDTQTVVLKRKPGIESGTELGFLWLI